jgi:hypothetical protein
MKRLFFLPPLGSVWITQKTNQIAYGRYIKDCILKEKIINILLPKVKKKKRRMAEQQKSPTFCELCHVECQNGANWSRHIASKRHIKKMTWTPAATSSKIVVNIDIDNDDDDYCYVAGKNTNRKLPI